MAVFTGKGEKVAEVTESVVGVAAVEVFADELVAVVMAAENVAQAGGSAGTWQ